jgi:uncharacterized protein YaaN involved in tellurite resistance
MRIKRVIKQIKATRQSLDEVRRDNREYFAALAEQIGEKAAQEVEERCLQEIAKELEAVTEGEIVDVQMVQLVDDDDEERISTDENPA